MSEGTHLRWRTAKRIREQFRDCWQRQGLQSETMERGAGGFERLNGMCQQMTLVHLIVAIGTDQQKGLNISTRQQRRQQMQGRGVSPLQIVKKHHQWMLFPRQHANEALKYHAEAVLRLRR